MAPGSKDCDKSGVRRCVGGFQTCRHAIRWWFFMGTFTSRRPSKDCIASLEHPCNSFIWEAEEIAELNQSGLCYETRYSHCYLGRERTKWTLLFHNYPFLHRALHKPDCPGHQHLDGWTLTRPLRSPMQGPCHLT